MIKIKSNIQIIEEGKKLLFYNTETRQILVEMEMTNKQVFDLKEFCHAAYYYQTIEEIASGKYRQIILSLYKKKPEFFDVADPKQTEQALTQNDIELTVDKNLFFLTFNYNVAEHLKQREVVFWGESEATKLVIDSLLPTAKSITVYTTAKENKSIYSEEVVRKNWLEAQSATMSDQAIHVIYENNFSSEQLELLNKQLDKNATVLYYKAGINELFIGPLVIGEETCSYTDYQVQCPSTAGRLSKSAAYIGAGLINRIVYFLILEALPYIGEDAQLPINSVFKMNTYTLALDTHKIFKGVSKNESRSEKYFQEV